MYKETVSHTKYSKRDIMELRRFKVEDSGTGKAKETGRHVAELKG